MSVNMPLTNGVHFSTILQAEGLQLYQKYAPLQVFSKIFAQIYCYLLGVSGNFTNLYFTENVLVAGAGRCNVLKIFIFHKSYSIYAGP